MFSVPLKPPKSLQCTIFKCLLHMRNFSVLTLKHNKWVFSLKTVAFYYKRHIWIFSFFSLNMCLLYQVFRFRAFHLCFMFKSCIFKSVKRHIQDLRKWKTPDTVRSFSELPCLFRFFLKSIFSISASQFVKPCRCNNHLKTMNCKIFRGLRSTSYLSNFWGKKFQIPFLY